MSKEVFQRRSSVKNPHVQEEVRGVDPKDIFVNIPEYNMLTNISRLSGNSQRGSFQNKRGSGIPTPIINKATTSGTSGAQFKGRVTAAAVIPRVSALAGRPPPGASASRSRSASSSRNVPSTGNTRGSTLTRGNSVNNLTSSTLNNTRRKSKSYESLLQTPAFTPGASRSRSKSPFSTARRKGILNEGGDPVKNIKITKEKKVLAEMARFIFEFLDSEGCQWNPEQWKDFVNPTNISGAKFIGIVKFVASYFVGETFFHKKDKDIEDSIIEVTKLLRYPCQLSKSHLKTATAQHAWPSCITFLAWLCCRAQTLLMPPPERRIPDEISNNGMEEPAFQSYLALFPHHFLGTLTQEIMDEELVRFKERICEVHTIELTKTKEELIQEKNEREAELERLKNEPDPAKEVKERFAAATEVSSVLQNKIQDAEALLKKYSDVNHLVLEQDRIGFEIKTKKMELKRLKQQVEGQVLSKEEASAVQNDTNNLKIQLESLASVNKQLHREIETRNSKLASLQKDLYELCSMFTIVERYNDIVRYLQLDELAIPPNPFAPNELVEWIKNSAKTLRMAEAKVNDVARQVNDSTDQKSLQHMKYFEQLERLCKEVGDYQLKCQQADSYLKFLTQEQEKISNAEEQELQEANNELQNEKAKYEAKRKIYAAYVKAHRDLEERLGGYKNAHQEWSDKVLQETMQFMKEKSETQDKLVQMTLEAAKSQQDFYLELFGVDIFQGALDQEDANQ